MVIGINTPLTAALRHNEALTQALQQLLSATKCASGGRRLASEELKRARVLAHAELRRAQPGHNAVKPMRGANS